MDLDELRAFVSVADSGSFKSAASALGQPRGTLRRRVDALESRAGIPLLERGRAGVSLTQAGIKFIRHGRQMLREASSLMRTLRTLETRSASVRIGLPLGFPPAGFQHFNTFVARTLPHLRLELRFSEDPLSELINDLDFALSFKPAPPSRQLLSMPLVEFHAGLVASEAYLARNGTPRSVAELSEHRLLSWLHSPAEKSRWPLLSGDYIRINPVLDSFDFQLIRGLAAGDGGIALLPDTNLPKLDPMDRKLVRVLPDQIGRRHQLHLHVNAAIADQTEDFDAMTTQIHSFMKSMVPPTALIAKQPLRRPKPASSAPVHAP